MFYNLCYIFMFFFIASILGYFTECTFCSVGSKKLVYNRGFLLGPYIPIYGVGASLVVLLLMGYKDDPIIFFSMTCIICSLLEYFTSYFMEKIFNVRWWDYSDDKFNLNGRICLQNSILFGLIGLVVLYTIYPLITSILNMLDKNVLEIIAFICFVIFTLDFSFTTKALSNVKGSLKMIKGDATNEAHKKVMTALKKHSFQFNRLIGAFPHIETFNPTIVKTFKEKVLELKNKRKENK